MPRLLKEPDGCRVSSLRKILLLQFSDLCLLVGHVKIDGCFIVGLRMYASGSLVLMPFGREIAQ
jgi:hypothetical protein